MGEGVGAWGFFIWHSGGGGAFIRMRSRRRGCERQECAPRTVLGRLRFDPNVGVWRENPAQVGLVFVRGIFFCVFDLVKG